MACISVFNLRWPGRIRTAIDNLKHRYWMRFQNGNAHLQNMGNAVALLKHELEAAIEAVEDREYDGRQDAAVLLHSALDSLYEVHKAIEERL